MTMNGDRVGLEFCDGRVLYCNRSVLTNAQGSYFAARFGGNIPAGGERRDTFGRSVYCVDGDGELFGRHILPFLLRNDPVLPPFSKDPILWHRLRLEAVFYGLEGLVQRLYVTKTIVPNEAGRGVLYWLGTNKGTREYRNPSMDGQVHFGGWFDMSPDEFAADARTRNNDPSRFTFSSTQQARTEEYRAMLVQHRPPIKGIDDLQDPNYLLCPCYVSDTRLAEVIVDLKSITLKPTAYSLRYGGCYGLTYWNLEGSNDKLSWDVLHAARGDEPLLGPSKEDVDKASRIIDRMSESEAQDIMLSYMESDHRRTWSVTSHGYYRYFRLVEKAGEQPDKKCTHGMGLELYGDVHEEYA